MDGYTPGSVFSQMKPRSSRPKNVQGHSGFGVSAKRSLMKKLAFVKLIALPVILGVGLSLVTTAFLKKIGLIGALM